MCKSAKKQRSARDIIGYTLPRLHMSKNWYVDFFAYDPTIDGLKRKKYMLDRYPKKERKHFASVLINNLTQQLMAGWNPFVNNDKARSYTLWETIVKRYTEYVNVSASKGMLKSKTATDYLSRLSGLLAYLDESNASIKYVYQFDKTLVVDFLDYIVFDKERSAKTRNNYRTWLSTFCTLLVDRQYITANFIEEIKTMKEEEKYRDNMKHEDLSKLKEYTQEKKPAFYLACMMEYYTFIRPEELRHIRIGNISIKDQCITIPAEVSKNRKEQAVALNDKLLKVMIDQGVFSHPSSDYLFGKDLTPGAEPLAVNRIRQEWARVRKALKFPHTYQFYSLKDSGIRDLANAEGIVVARDQARHTDISVTNRYLKSAKVANEATKHFKGEL